MTWIRRFAVGLLTLVALVSCLHIWLLDGIHGWFLSKISTEDTDYAAGYSGSGFRRVRNGMTKDEVVGLVGLPIERGHYAEESLELWLYAVSPSDSSYRVRTVQFRGGTVVGKVSRYYID